MTMAEKTEITKFTTRHNVMPIHSIQSFAGIRGGNHLGCKDVYFIRCLGVDSGYINQIRNMDRLLEEGEMGHRGNYVRLSQLPGLLEQTRMEKYSKQLDHFLTDKDSFTGTENRIQNQLPDFLFIQGICRVEKEFLKDSPQASKSMVRNFLIKVLYWTESLHPFLFADWNGKNTCKFVYSGNIKKQEYLFCFFLTLLGIDVLLLLPEGEPNWDPGLLALSKEIVLERQEACLIPPYEKNKEKETIRREEIKSHECEGRRPTLSAAAILARPVRNQRAEPEKGQVQTPRMSSAQSMPREMEFEELARLASSVVMITMYDKKGAVTGSGSGIMIGERGFILTNNHVASGGATYSVMIEEEEQAYHTSELIKWNSTLDLAVIRISRSLRPIPLYKGKDPLVRGQKVVAIGSPLGLFNSVSNGIISGFREIRDIEMIQFTAPISHGSSGGALLNMYGEIIGICTAGFDNGQNINLAVDYKNISRFVSGFE